LRRKERGLNVEHGMVGYAIWVAGECQEPGLDLTQKKTGGKECKPETGPFHCNRIKTKEGTPETEENICASKKRRDRVGSEEGGRKKTEGGKGGMGSTLGKGDRGPIPRKTLPEYGGGFCLDGRTHRWWGGDGICRFEELPGSVAPPEANVKKGYRPPEWPYESGSQKKHRKTRKCKPKGG